MVLKAPQKIFFFAQKISLKIDWAVSIRVMNFAPLNEPLNIFKIFFYFNPKVAHT
jgi:hypothetical protein